MAKRLVDLALGGLLSLAVLPFVVLLAALTAAALRATPFFRQQRIGRDGRPFTLIKLRTLPRSAPRYADKYAIAVVATPSLCQWMRRWHLDELPQLFLVPLGRLSLVGPRPEMPFMHARMPERFAAARTTVRPGCTGLWQISDVADRLIGEAPEYDLAYLQYGGLAMDCWILWRTVLQVAGLAGPVSLVDVPAWVLPAGRRGLVPVEVREELAA